MPPLYRILGVQKFPILVLLDKKRGGYTGSPAYMAPERFY